MRAEVLITLILIACCALFSSLGYWQMSRAEEKRLIEEQLEASYASAPSELQGQSTPFSRVRTQGRFNPQIQFLIDNRVVQGQPGYQVIQAFDTENGLRLLVDRGWTGTRVTQAKQDVPIAPTGRAEIIGLLLPDFGAGVTFDSPSTDQPSDSWPIRLQSLNLEKIVVLAEADFPHMLKLRNGEPGALGVQTFELPMGSARHSAYAVQWFGLALAGLIIWFVLARRHLSRRNTSDA